MQAIYEFIVADRYFLLIIGVLATLYVSLQVYANSHLVMPILKKLRIVK